MLEVQSPGLQGLPEVQSPVPAPDPGLHHLHQPPLPAAVATTFPDDCLPPEAEYESRDALFRSINAWAATRGYAFVIKKSVKEKSGKSTVTYACDRSRRPPSPSRERQRRTTTRMTSCPFSILAKESLEGIWTLKYRPDSRFSIHNHEPSQHPSAHPVHRQLSLREGGVTQLTTLSNAGVSPKEIQTCIRQSGSLATRQDINNRIAAIRRETCEGQSPIHALVDNLQKEGFWSRIQLASDDRVTAIFFAHPGSLAFLQAYPEILLLDCTYKTNKYSMPLLDMIGVDASQRSFCIAFAFLSGETEADYLWALEQLKSLYEQCQAPFPSVILTDRCLACINAVSTLFPSSPALLCIWHANKAVVSHCKPAFLKAEKWEEFYQFWHSIINSSTEEIYEERLSEFRQQYIPGHLNEVGYIQTTWLNPFKERLVKAWVDKCTHFGNIATSRVEGIHSLLKSYLKRSTIDLFDAWKAINLALRNQLSDLKSNQAREQIRNPLELSGALYGVVCGWVSYAALRKVEEQRKLLLEKDPPPSPICTGTFTRVYGLPCRHTLEALQGEALLLDHFHSHWHLRRDGAPRLLLEPRQRIEPVRARSSLPRSSTKREPSYFEVVEAQTSRTGPAGQVGQARRAPSQCTNCGAVGHIRTSKACPLRYSEIL
jgi:hypothetical protein